MSTFEDGFLGLNLEDDTPTLKAIDISIITISSLIQITIGIVAFIAVRKDPQNNKTLIKLFIVSLCCAGTFTITKFFDDVSLKIDFISHTTLGWFFISLFATLVLRLYLTFKGSVFRMSRMLIVMFSILMIIYVVGTIALAAVHTLLDADFAIIGPLSFLLLFSYIIGCILAIHFFVSNLSKLVKAGEINPNISPRNIALNELQQELAEVAAKYTMLFGLAMISTLLSQIVSLFFNLGSGLRAPLWSLDMCINLWCIFLQFSAAKDHYKRWCGCCDRGFRNVTSMRFQRALQLMATKQRDSLASDSPPSPDSGPTLTPESAKSCSGGEMQGVGVVTDSI